MKFREFFFSYKTILKLFISEKKYFKVFRKIFGYPYKYILEIIRIFFSIKKKNLDHEKFDYLKKKSLDDLFIFFNSDKGTKVNFGGEIVKGHNYSHLYERYFSKYKFKKEIKILEIGSLLGASAASFLKYFEDPEIYCLDVNPFQIQYTSKRINKLYINTRYRKTLNQVSSYLDFQFDIIIDDGSHNKKDQILTLNYFLPKLKSKGIYVIEDTCHYLSVPALNDDKLDYGANDFVQSVFNTGNHYSKYLDDSEKKNIRQMINSLNLEKGNFIFENESLPEIIFIEKK